MQLKVKVKNVQEVTDTVEAIEQKFKEIRDLLYYLKSLDIEVVEAGK